jgi:hypothetical protein
MVINPKKQTLSCIKGVRMDLKKPERTCGKCDNDCYFWRDSEGYLTIRVKLKQEPT